jgi:hypothetical protein
MLNNLYGRTGDLLKICYVKIFPVNVGYIWNVWMKSRICAVC